MSNKGVYWKPAAPSADYNFRESFTDSSSTPIYGSTRSSSGYAPLQQQRRLLPIYKHRRQILYAVENYPIVVIVGETGSGKSTQIPQYLVQEGGWAANDFQVVVTQPRRVAATTLAQRVGQEYSKSKVGYVVRFDDQTTPYTQIRYVTDGILLQEASSADGDPLLSRYSVVMVDEAHERTLNSDILLGLLKKIRRKRPDLRLIICSATIDAQQFMDFFVKHTNDKATIISVDGKQFPVDMLYLKQPAPDYVNVMVEAVWQIHSKRGNEDVGGETGDILCFLPTGEDIDRSIRLAQEYFQQQQADKSVPQAEFLPLYGNLPYHMQAKIFQLHGGRQKGTKSKKQHPEAVRRIIFATNIAETSVTVPRISYVVDSGLVKLPYFDPVASLERLIVGPISKASAKQRAGRAGRIGAGQCYRLYTESYLMDSMHDHTPPEILRTNLTSFLLNLKALGVDNILAFDLLDLPSVEAIQHGLETLFALGAIDESTQITKDGLDMAAFPVEPRVARMLLESLSLHCSWEVLAVASSLQVRDLFLKPRGGTRRQQEVLDFEEAMSQIADPTGDHVTYANLFSEMDDVGLDERGCQERFVNYLSLRRGLEVRKQLVRFLKKFGKVQASGFTDGDGLARSKAIRRCVAAGFFSNVAKLRNDGRYYTLRKGVLVNPLSSTSVTGSNIVGSEYIVFGETMDGSSARGGIDLRHVSAIEARWLRELAPHYWE